MFADERPLRAKLSGRPQVASENALLVTIAIGFLILHIVTGTLVQRAPAATSPSQEEARASFAD